MNIPKGCRHRGKFKKDCCEILWNGVIVEHDGCVTNEGCDVVAYDNHIVTFIEIKGGNISSQDASDIVKQIEICERFYSHFIVRRKRYRLFLHCIDKKKRKKKRLDSYARTKLKMAKVITEECKGTFNLNDFTRL